MNFHETHFEEIHSEATRFLPYLIEMKANNLEDSMIEKLHKDADIILEKAGLWKQASCKGACSSCCHDTILMSPSEANYIKKKIKESGIVGNAERIAKQSSGKPLKWMEKACPYLLDENEEGKRLCSIYEFRPLVCRAHNSTEDPKFCNKEDYPGRFINEGRVIPAEAIPIALMILDSNLLEKEPELIPIHTL